MSVTWGKTRITTHKSLKMLALLSSCVRGHVIKPTVFKLIGNACSKNQIYPIKDAPNTQQMPKNIAKVRSVERQTCGQIITGRNIIISHSFFMMYTGPSFPRVIFNGQSISRGGLEPADIVKKLIDDFIMTILQEF